jgi:WD40 repeat protein
LLTTSADRTARIWDPGTGQQLVALDHRLPLHSGLFSPDGSQVLTWDEETAYLWDSATGKRIAIMRGHTGWIYSAAFSADGRRVLTSSRDGTTKIYTAAPSDLAREYLATAIRLLRYQPRELETIRGLVPMVERYLTLVDPAGQPAAHSLAR